MKRKMRIDEDMPSDKARIIPDFLPPPEKLIFPSDTTKVTIYLDSDSVEFFKKQAKKIGAKYQRMMREVLRRYAHHHSQHAA
jgi:predicted DNA binding CopG/RHH family protein